MKKKDMSQKRMYGSPNNKYTILSKCEQSTHLIEIAFEMAM